MAAMASLMNGERAVVVFFVARVVFAVPPSLLFHGLALALLALAALSLEIRFEISNSLPLFKTSLGASSGILLGTVALPTVMMSKLIQISRALSLNEVSIEELEHLTMQYWATSACCLGVLVYLCIVIWRAPDIVHSLGLRSVWNANFSLSCIVFYAALCCVSLGTISLTGFNTVLKSFWMLFHGLAAVKLIQHLLSTFPSCASIGEALLMSSGLVLYFGDMLALTIAKASRWLITSEVIRYGSKRSEIGIIIQGLLLGLLLFPAGFKLVLQLWECYLRKVNLESRTYNEILRSLIFFSSLGFIMIVIIPSWMQFVQDFHMHPLLWVFSFVFSEPSKRLSLCIYWICIIFISILRFYNISKNSKIERILLRKYYHIMAVLMFLPALIYQPKLLDLAFGAALGVFLALEIIRASMVGYKYGVLRWSKSGKKTIEGTAAGITSVLAACSILLPLLASTGYTEHWFSLIVAVTVSGMLEAYTAQLDNAFIPLVFYSLLCL
ncbi:hypothetical protein UlMin_028928 [Ulmus minor]